MNFKERIGIRISSKIKNLESVLKTIYECQKIYHENLLNNNVMFVVENDKKDLIFLETFFPKSAFMHLTGVTVLTKNNKPLIGHNFYNYLINNKLSSRKYNIKIKDAFTFSLKLQVLGRLFNIEKNAKMMGDFAKTGILLNTDKLIGGTNSCMGFVKSKNSKYYIPNTILNQDIRSLTNSTYKVIAILKKRFNDKQYSQITYLKRNCEIEKLAKSIEISKLINFRNLYSHSNSVIEKIKEFKKK